MKILKIIGSFVPLLMAGYIFYLANETGTDGESLTDQQRNGMMFMSIFMVGVFIYALMDALRNRSKH